MAEFIDGFAVGLLAGFLLGIWSLAPMLKEWKSDG